METLHLTVRAGATALAMTLLLTASACNTRVSYGDNALTGQICPASAACPEGSSGAVCCARQAGDCSWEDTCGGGSGTDGGGTDAGEADGNGGSDTRPIACSDQDCGPIPPVVPCTGSNEGRTTTCEAGADGSCGWVVSPCPDEETCTYNGQTYQVEETFDSGDGCNGCQCMKGGSVGCSLIECGGCYLEDGRVFANGDTFRSTDGCSGCSCNNGETLCTAEACAPLQWYETCGDPVCSSEINDDPNVPNCDTQQAGNSCSDGEPECELLDGCGTRLRCTASDPTQQAGGCPRSKAEYKNDVQYLGQKELQKVAQDLLSINLTTYKYNANVNPRTTGGDLSARHLGFIIDDVGQSAACVNPDGQSVNLYGYTSMAVATLKVQAQQIEALKNELAELKRAIKSSRR